MTTDVRPFLTLLQSENVQAAIAVAKGRALHIVGGALRDAVLGLHSPDLDLVVAGQGDSFAADLSDALCARLVRLGGDRFSAYRIVASNSIIDIWDRSEQSLLADLERRDLTVNAMALDPVESTLRDPFGGGEDLAARRLKAVTESSFLDDPLRVVRLARFAQFLDSFSIDEATRTLAQAAAPGLPQVASERVREEVSRLLALPPAVRAFRLLNEIRVLPEIWRRSQGSPASLSALEPTLGRFDSTAPELATLAGLHPNRQLTLFALVEICLNASDGRARSADGDSRRLPTRLTGSWLTKSQMRAVARLEMIAPEDTKLSPRRFLRRWGTLWSEAAAVAWSLQDEDGKEAIDWARSLTELVEAEGDGVLAPKPLIDGNEICRILEIDPGPEVGQILERLLDAEMDGLIESREQALELLPKLARQDRR